MSDLKHRLADFQPPADWASDHWSDKINAHDPNYAQIVAPWFDAQPADVIRHFLRDPDMTSGSIDRQIGLWLINQPNLDKSSARLLFWTLMSQFPYFADQTEREDQEHGADMLGTALQKLADNIAADRYPDAGLGLNQAELDHAMRLHLPQKQHAISRGWTEDQAPFPVPANWSSPIPGRNPTITPKFPAPTDPLIATFMTRMRFPTRHDFIKRASKFDTMSVSDNLLVWGVKAASALFVLYIGYRLYLGGL